MKVETKRFGIITISKEDIIEFPQGIPGFSDKRRFVLLKEGEGPFYWLQSLDDPNLAFVITNPLFFAPDYRIKLHRSQLEDIGLEDLTKGEVWVFVSIRKDPFRVTINLQAPILVNKENGLAKQVLLSPEEYPLQYEILRAEKEKVGS